MAKLTAISLQQADGNYIDYDIEDAVADSKINQVITDYKKADTDIIEGNTPVKRISNTATKGGVQVATVEDTVASAINGNPTGTIIPVMGEKHEIEGYLCCDGTHYEKATYPRLAALLGEQFSVDGGHFAIDLRNRFLQSVSKDSQGTTINNWGKTEEAGLPNITGKFLIKLTADGNSITSPNSFDGAFKYGGISAGNRVSANQTYYQDKGQDIIKFDASQGGITLYGKSETVQPPAIRFYFYIKY